MKPKITPTQNEIRMHDGEFIVSKTDTKGRITYSNRTFMRISGYSEKELLHSQHNIVRHPDMPRGVFRLLWRTLEQGSEFFGYVKNLTADGSYYWVFANVTPDFDSHGKLMGYYSVRRKPRPEALQIIEPIYREMLSVEQQAGSRDGPDAAIRLLEQKLAEQEQSYERFVLELQG
jgi:PAS domain S-box-containing protein